MPGCAPHVFKACLVVEHFSGDGIRVIKLGGMVLVCMPYSNLLMAGSSQYEGYLLIPNVRHYYLISTELLGTPVVKKGQL